VALPANDLRALVQQLIMAEVLARPGEGPLARRFGTTRRAGSSVRAQESSVAALPDVDAAKREEP
jgi:hypothetical protein